MPDVFFSRERKSVSGMDLMALPEFVKLGLYMATIFVANMVQALTGFAGVMLSMPPTILLFGPDMAKAVVNAVSWIVCAYLMIKNRRFIDKKELTRILLFMFIGMGIGVHLYSVTNPSVLIPFYGLIIVCVALKNLLMKPTVGPLPSWLSILILLGAGIIHGLFVSGGALLVVYLAVTFRNKDAFRANGAAVWTILNVALMFHDFENGMYNADFFHLYVLGVIPLFVAIYLGNKIHDGINQKMFNKITYCLLLAAGSLILI